MHIHAASYSAAVTQALDAVIQAAGHTPATLADATLIVVDQLHPVSHPLPALPLVFLGVGTGDALPCPLRPYQLVRWLRQRAATQALPLGHGWQLDAQGRTLTHATQAPVPLTEKETLLLDSLAQALPAAVTRDQLLARVWGITHAVDTHTLETHIYRLRHKLNGITPAPCDVLTQEGAYTLTIQRG